MNQFCLSLVKRTLRHPRLKSGSNLSSTKSLLRLLYRHNSNFGNTRNYSRNFNSIKTIRNGMNFGYGINSHLLSKRSFSAITVNVPNMGDSISEGTLVEWSKSLVILFLHFIRIYFYFYFYFCHY